MQFIKSMKKRNIVVLSIAAIFVLGVATVGLFTVAANIGNFGGNSGANNNNSYSSQDFEDQNDYAGETSHVYSIDNELPAGVAVLIGGQEIRTEEVDMIRRMHVGDGDEELLLGMYLYMQITHMLLFEYAQSIGIAPTESETNDFIIENRHFVPESDFLEMGISEDEYWSGMGFRLAQNMLMTDNLMNFLNDNDSTTEFAIEQHDNFFQLGRDLMSQWMEENQSIVQRYHLQEASSVFSELSD